MEKVIVVAIIVVAFSGIMYYMFKQTILKH